MEPAYDVAISFLARDEALALRIYNELSESLHVFVYSKRQEELAGTDGLESFRKVFLADSRLVVVLYRDGWGKTRWTAVEEMAIKERVFNGGWEQLLFVTLDEQGAPPGWLPKTHLRLSYPRYGDALIGAIKMRAQELGSALRVETAIERAKRLQADELARAKRAELLTNEGDAAVRREHGVLRRELEEKIADAQGQLTTMKLGSGNGLYRGYVIRTDRVSLSFYLDVDAPVTKSRIVVEEFDAPLILSEEHRMYFPGEGPRKISSKNYYFDYQHAYGWCWSPDSSEHALATSTLAEHILKNVFELHEQFASGTRVRCAFD
jgi:hypothetical protein